MTWLTLIPYFKAIHIIGFVTWFAGLFYLVRLFVYHAEALQKTGLEKEILCRQFSLMEWRLFYIITWPGMLITLICGTAMIAVNPWYLSAWLHVKLGLIALLVIYHFWCGAVLKRLSADQQGYSSGFFRMMNEVATLLLVAIVFLAVLKNMMNFFYGFLGFIGLMTLLFAGIRIYKSIRKDN